MFFSYYLVSHLVKSKKNIKYLRKLLEKNYKKLFKAQKKPTLSRVLNILN